MEPSGAPPGTPQVSDPWEQEPPSQACREGEGEKNSLAFKCGLLTRELSALCSLTTLSTVATLAVEHRKGQTVLTVGNAGISVRSAHDSLGPAELGDLTLCLRQRIKGVPLWHPWAREDPWRLVEFGCPQSPPLVLGAASGADCPPIPTGGP